MSRVEKWVAECARYRAPEPPEFLEEKRSGGLTAQLRVVVLPEGGVYLHWIGRNAPRDSMAISLPTVRQLLEWLTEMYGPATVACDRCGW